MAYPARRARPRQRRGARVRGAGARRGDRTDHRRPGPPARAGRLARQELLAVRMRPGHRRLRVAPRGVAVAAGGKTFVGFKRHLRVAVVEGEAAYLVSPTGVTALRGRHIAVLAPLLDGSR